MTISRLVKKGLLTIAITSALATSFQTHAAVGGVVSIFSAGAGVPIVLVGLGVSGVSLAGIINDEDDMASAVFLFYGLVLLDGENGQEIQFNEIAHQNLLNIGLTNNEAISYSGNFEELSTSFRVVKSQLDENSSKEDSELLWQEQEEILGVDAINAARKILQFNIDNAIK